MSRQIQIRRGTATEHANFTGAEGEVTYDTTAKTLRVHDGTTAGGTVLAKQSEIPDLSSITPMKVPDYTNAYDVSGSSFTATELCFVSCDAWNSTVRINGNHIGYGANTVNIQVFLSQGDTISGYSSPLHVFPLKVA